MLTPVSAANALIKLWLTAGQDSAPADLAAAYTTCLRIATYGFSPLDADTRDKYRALVLRQLAVDLSRIPALLLHNMIEDVRESCHAEDNFHHQVALVLDENMPPSNDPAPDMLRGDH